MNGASALQEPDMPLSDANLLKVRDNVFVTLAAVAVRQALLFLAGAALPMALARGGAEAVAVALLLLITLGWGQWRSWQAKRRELILAEDAPHAVIVKKES
jgi:hypothetical protein